MAAKPMPRLRAGISGSPLITSAKRSLTLHVKPKSPDSRSPTRHATGISKKEVALPIKKIVANDHVLSTGSDSSKQLTYSLTDLAEHDTTTKEKVSRPIDFNLSSSNREEISVNFDKPSSSNSQEDQAQEVERLKELMQLQISLINRQQDLLKLRDKEIEQLKTQNQSFENRLERMERRISLSRRQSDTTNSSSGFEKSCKSNKPDSLDHNVLTNKVLEENIESKATEDVLNQKEYPSSKLFYNSSNRIPGMQKDNLHSPDVRLRAASADTQVLLASPISLVHSAYVASGCIPVPPSYLERYRSDSSTSVCKPGSLPPVVVKVCEHCPECKAIVKEMKQEFPSTTFQSDCNISKDQASPSNSFSPSLLSKAEKVSDNCPSDATPYEVALQAEHPYHLITWPREDQSYPFTDLDLSLDEGSTLNIPTWKTNKLTPLTGVSNAPGKEAVDDDTIWKRHSRLEVAEKRRKRWDIQRIREFRYNEKLRQKQSKQGEDQYSIDTFSPSLSDITALQIEETLPVNVFGHTLQPLLKKEFSLDSEL